MYFLVECAENISPYTDPLWMNLYIDCDPDNQGWETFDYVINKTSPSATHAALERFVDGYESEMVGTVEYTVDGRVQGAQVKNLKTGEIAEVSCDGIFVSIGRKPNTALFEGQIELDQAGYIVAGETTHTNLPGVYAVGDVRTKALRQVVTAVGDGAVAVHFAEEYLAQG